MAKLRYDTVREHRYTPFEIARLSDSLQSAGQPCHLSHVVPSGPDPVRLAQVQDVIETVVVGRKYEVLLLRTQGKSLSEIALILSISKSAVQSHYRRAIQQVRQALGLEFRRSNPSVKIHTASPSA